RTPYTVGALAYARALGALTIALTCVPASAITEAAELSIVPLVGPEVVTGSTRLKAGTAQKLVLNMISTAVLTKLGYVSGNRMSHLRARNSKLHARALRILMAETGVDENTAKSALEAAQGETSAALEMIRQKLNP
ncbi:MAG: N-acetylmuramic acid 6-phosphate etherase, partial [Acidobacteriota bacterium]|nr:N-acetylmuramic acid 6-phosphate etherase [Acidobacteriota bacterium]